MTEVQADGGVQSRERHGAAAGDWQPHIVALVCNWCSYAGADMAGTTRLEYPATVRLVRFPCTGRMSPLMIVRAFELGADGVLVSGCHPGDCHYVQGNLVARRRFTIFRSLMDFIGVDLRRLHFAWVSAAEGQKWARVVDEVSAAVHEAGPRPSRTDLDVEVELPPLGAQGDRRLSNDDLQKLTEMIREAAAELLAEEDVGTVLGYRGGTLSGQVVPSMITDPELCDQLVWDQGCTTNLSAYLPTLLERNQRVAMIVKSCDLGAVAGLIREDQVPRDRVHLIGVPCPGVLDGADEAAKCSTCSGRPDDACDLVLSVDEDAGEDTGEDADEADVDVPAEGSDPRDGQVAYLESLSALDRWRYWQRQFARCLRCYACRAACPLCYCSSCISEKHRPQWISPVISGPGNSAWNIVRAFHLAGRCTGCDECARVCPADIRLDLINRKLALEVERQYGSAGLDPEARSALIDFRLEDSEEFVL
jgi:coenzyme F420-reducing hydrogenase delta subunit/ferredoxin